MVAVTHKHIEVTELADIVRREVSMYAAPMLNNDQLVAILDDEQGRYAVAIIPGDRDERPAWVFVMARVVGEYVVIDEDTDVKPLLDALMHNGGIPREKIVLAYRGESLPQTSDE